MAKPPKQAQRAHEKQDGAVGGAPGAMGMPRYPDQGPAVLVTIEDPKSSHAWSANINLSRGPWPMAGAGLRRKSHRSVGQTDAIPMADRPDF